MNNIQVFNNKEFGEIRAVQINNNPYFNLNDICRILDIKNPKWCKNKAFRRWGRYYRGHR